MEWLKVFHFSPSVATKSATLACSSPCACVLMLVLFRYYIHLYFHFLKTVLNDKIDFIFFFFSISSYFELKCLLSKNSCALIWFFLYPRSLKGEGGILFYLCPSKIFFVAFFSVTVDDRNLIFGHKRHVGIPYCG